MSDNSTRDLIVGAALALLLYWHFHKSGSLSASYQTNGLLAAAPSGAAGAGTSGAGGGTASSGCGCSGASQLHVALDRPQITGAYVGIA